MQMQFPRKRTVIMDPGNDREVLREQSKSVLNDYDPTYSGALNLTLEKARTIRDQISDKLAYSCRLLRKACHR